MGSLLPRWTKDGIAFVSQSSPGRQGGEDLLDTQDFDAIVVRWRELRLLEAVDPWPTIHLVWHSAGSMGESTLGARIGNAEEFAKEVEALFAHVRKYRPDALHPGWLDIPDVLWETADAFPQDDDLDESGGPYRAAPVRSTERVLARRPQSGWTDRALAHVFRPPWREIAGEVAVTAERVWLRRRSGVVRSMDLAHLRYAQRRVHARDLFFVFGRRSELSLPHFEDCPVEAFFEQHLAKRDIPILVAV